MEALIGLFGLLTGTVLTMLYNLANTRIQYLNSRDLDQRRWGEERNRNQIQDVKDALWHYIDRMEMYVSERRALMIALNNPLLQPQTVMNNLFKETWKIGSLADEAAVIAANFGYDVLAQNLLEFEKQFSLIWRTKIGKGDGQDLQELEGEVIRNYEKIISSILELRAKIPQLNIPTSHKFEVSELPRLMHDADTKQE